MDIVKHTGSLGGIPQSEDWEEIETSGTINDRLYDTKLNLTTSSTSPTGIYYYTADVGGSGDNMLLIDYTMNIGSNLAQGTVTTAYYGNSLYNIIGATPYQAGGTSKDYRGIMLYDSTNAEYPALFVGMVNVSGLGSVLVTDISFSAVDNPPVGGYGYGQDFSSGLGTWDDSSTHANHTITYDGVGERLKLTATGAGTSWFVFDYSRSSGPVQQLLVLSDVTASCTVGFVKEGGATYTSYNATSNGSHKRLSGNNTTTISQIGLYITTAGAGDVYIDKWAFLDTNPIEI